MVFINKKTHDGLPIQCKNIQLFIIILVAFLCLIVHM
jgi:hypothetical protein